MSRQSGCGNHTGSLLGHLAIGMNEGLHADHRIMVIVKHFSYRLAPGQVSLQSITSSSEPLSLVECADSKAITL